MNERKWPLNKLKGIIPHLFLPRRLPESQQNDLINIEQDILHIVELATEKLNSGLFRNVFPRTCKLFQNWVTDQPQLSSGSSEAIAEIIQSLECGDMLAFYIRSQNAGLFLSMPESSSANVILSSFQASSNSESVMSATGDLGVIFPETSVVIPRSEALNSKELAEQLCYFTRHQIHMTLPKSSKSGHTFNEVRDVADPMLITDWITAALCNQESHACVDFPRISKKVRDDVIRTKSFVPFRRSGLWMTAKVALQISLIGELGKEHGQVMYKAVMITILHFILIQLPENMDENWDLKMQMMAKIARRLEKLRPEVTKWSEVQRLSDLVASDIQRIRGILDDQWQQVITSGLSFQPITISKEQLRKDTHHKMDNLVSYIKKRRHTMNSPYRISYNTVVPIPSCPIRWRTTQPSPFRYSTSDDRDFELWDTEVWIRWNIDQQNCPFVKTLMTDYTKKASSHYRSDPIANSRMVLTLLKCLQVLDKIATAKCPSLKSHRSGVDLTALQALLIPLESDMELVHELENYFIQRDSAAIYPSIIEEDVPTKNSFSVKFAQQCDEMKKVRTSILEQADRDIESKKAEVRVARAELQALRKRTEELKTKLETEVQIESESELNLQTEVKVESELDLKISALKSQVELKSRLKSKPQLIAALKLQLQSDLKSKHHLQQSVSNLRKIYSDRSTQRMRTKNEVATLREQCNRKEYSVTPFERPLPREVLDQFAVIFELLIPPEVACLRDMLHNFHVDICSNNSAIGIKNAEICKEWIKYDPISRYSTNAGNAVMLGSKSKPALHNLRSHYSNLSVDRDECQFILENKMNVQFKTQINVSGMEPLKKRCTFSIENTEVAYRDLQWAVNSTSHTPNEVLAKQYSCPPGLRLSEFIQFGNLRAGHRLQYRNIIMSLVNGKLSLKSKSVFLLLCQAQWQIGPPSQDFLRDSHKDFSEAPFAIESLKILFELVDANSKNWSDSYILINLVVISTRLLELVADKLVRLKASELLRKCRMIADSWIHAINDQLSKVNNAPEREKADLKSKLVDAALCLILTFHVSSQNAYLVMSSKKDVILWLNAVSTLHTQTCWNMTIQTATNQALLRLSKHIGTSLEPVINAIIGSETGAIALNTFTKGRWKNAEKFGIWKQRPSPAEQVYECLQTISNAGTCHTVHVDIILGKFLVDGCPVGTLPTEIVNSEGYKRVFQNTGFEVQPNKDRIYTTTTPNHGLIYNFSLQNGHLIVSEIEFEPLPGESKRKLELIPHTLFSHLIPYNLIENYSHWWNCMNNTILFRPKCFEDPEFTTSKKHVFFLQSMTLQQLQDNGKARYLIATTTTSQSCIKLTPVIQRLELQKYIHIWLDEKDQVEIELSKLGLKFKLENGSLVSKEFPGMKISNDQVCGTLVGLENKLVLEGKRISQLFNPTKKIIIPHGVINIFRNTGQPHQSVTINLDNLSELKYFVYEIDERLQILKAGRNQAAWFYLAALHAATSSPISDPFTGVTGTEMAFQILQSSRCWSCQPYDKQSIKSLEFIAMLSPIREYYPSYLKCMQQVTWPSHISSTVAHEGFAELALKLYEDSTRLEILFNAVNNTMKETDGDLTTVLSKSNKDLRKKFYWRQLPFTNESATISKHFDQEFQRSEPKVTPYTRTSLLPDRLKKTNDIRTVVDSCHKWKHYLEHSMVRQMRNLLINSTMLPGFTKKGMAEICSKNFQDFQNFDLRCHWLNMYCLARTVNDRNLRSKWTLMLSALAFKGIPVEHLLVLQTVAVNPEKFPDPPDCENYTCPNETFSKSVVEQFLRRNIKPFVKKCLCSPQFPTLKEHEHCERARLLLHNNMIELDITAHTELVASQWPISTCNGEAMSDSKKINIAKAYSLINSKLNQWFDNYRLTEFLKKVENELLTLCKTSSGQPNLLNLIPHVEDWQQSCTSTSTNNYGALMMHNIKESSSENADANIYAFPKLNSIAEYERQLGYVKSTSQDMWTEITVRLTPVASKALVASGLYPQMTPSTLLPMLLNTYEVADNNWKSLRDQIGAVAVLWTMEQRLIRCITYLCAGPSMEVALQREIETEGHEKWSPMNHPGWLILELEMNMMIRPIQFKVAQEMTSPRTRKNSVMQLNMGEGKTSLIVPMLAISLANGEHLCRVTVLKSIFDTNLNHLRHTLGGLLNQRIYSVPCRRDIEMPSNLTEAILTTYKECLKKRGIVITVPEYRLSFQLKGYEMARIGNSTVAESCMNIQTWLNKHARDILDESDEILSVKYQLVYTVGDQLHVGGGEMRWIIAQNLLKLLPRRMKDLFDLYGEISVEYDLECSDNPEAFTPCRLLRNECYEALISSLADDFLDGKLVSFPQLKTQERCLIKTFLTNNFMSKDEHEAALKIFDGESSVKYQEIILITAGYLRFGVLQVALGKRWRVNYGVNPKGQRKMAVPFKAKDVASERTEFGHPDMAIFLTQLSYYYSGLTDCQLTQCFDILKTHHRSPIDEYDSWMQTIPTKHVHASVRNYTGINLSDYDQRIGHLFPMLRKAMIVIDFWLSNVVFPKESKQFPGKMTCTAWDLCSQNQKLLTTGFSGTNDSSNLLPLPIAQNDLPELLNTNKELEITLLKPENNQYKSLPCGIRSRDLLQNLHIAGIRILLDCGALMLELNNEEVANAWLEIDTEIQAVVYFNKRNVLTLKSRHGDDVQFELSPFRDRMDVCAVYLDDEHTRGTDLKFPSGSKACVTVGSGLTRDKMVQACMRMRMLGQGHTVSFWASHEVHNKILYLGLRS